MKQKKKSKALRVIMVILCVLLTLVLLLELAGVAVLHKADSLLSSMSRLDPDVKPMSSEEIQQDIAQNTDPVDPDFTGLELDPDEVWKNEPQDTLPQPTVPKRDRIVNILLIGQDRRPGQGRQRSDAMILCTLNLTKKTLTMTSFLRDTYVKYPDGHIDNRLNAAYAWGGMPLLNDTLKLNFGVEVDGNFEVDFNSFVQVIDLLGGVEITLTNAEANWMRKSGLSVHAGTQRLSGEEALVYSRIRKLDNDFYRTNRQRKVLQSLLQSCKQSSISELMEILEAVLPLVATDMTNQQIMNLAADILPILKDLTVTSQAIPIEGGYTSAYVRGMYVRIPDLEANRKFLEETIMGS